MIKLVSALFLGIGGLLVGSAASAECVSQAQSEAMYQELKSSEGARITEQLRPFQVCGSRVGIRVLVDLLVRLSALPQLGSEKRIGLMQQALVHSEPLSDLTLRIEIILQLAGVEADAGMATDALQRLELARQECHRAKAEPLEIRVINLMATVEHHRGNFFEALKYQRMAWERARLNPAEFEAWNGLTTMGKLYQQLELTDLASENFYAAVKSADAFADARARYQTNLALLRFLNDERKSASALEIAGKIDLPQLSENDRSEFLIQSLRIQIALGNLAIAREIAGQVEAQLRRISKAQTAVESSIENASPIEGQTLRLTLHKAELLLLEEKPQAALEMAQSARIPEQDRFNQAAQLELLQRVYQKLQQPMNAALAERDYFRVRHAALGVGAKGKLSEIIQDFSVQEAKAHIAETELQAELGRTEISHRARQQSITVAALILLSIAFLLLWRRHQIVTTLNQKLGEKETALTQALESLKGKSAELYHASITDGLTGLFNRSYCVSELERWLSPIFIEPRTGNVALIMLDLDNFKSINDEHGHLVGDTVLREVAQLMMNAMPNDAVVARFGGEEFMILLKGRHYDQCLRLAENLRLSISKHAIHHAEITVHVTSSLGLYLIPQDIDCDPSAALKAVDSALYAAKHRGKNCLRTETHHLASVAKLGHTKTAV